LYQLQTLSNPSEPHSLDMHSLAVSLVAAGLAAFAQAYTQPTGSPTWGPLLTPDLSDSVTQGKDFTVTWDPETHSTDGVTVSLVLCTGPSTNCVPSTSAIASGLPAAQKSFDWKVPCDLAPGTQGTSTGYGMLIIVDQTGEYQYSTQFSVLANSACSGSTSSSSVTSSASASSITITASSGSSSFVVGPPAYQTSRGSAGWNNATTTATGSVTSTTFPASMVSSSFTYMSSGYSNPGTSTFVVGGSTFTTVPTGTLTEQSISATGAAASATFTGGAGQIGSSLAGIVAAGAVAVFAL